MTRWVTALAAAFVLFSSSASENPRAYLGLEFRWHGVTQKEKFLHVERVAAGSRR